MGADRDGGGGDLVARMPKLAVVDYVEQPVLMPGPRRAPFGLLGASGSIAIGAAGTAALLRGEHIAGAGDECGGAVAVPALGQRVGSLPAIGDTRRSDAHDRGGDRRQQLGDRVGVARTLVIGIGPDHDGAPRERRPVACAAPLAPFNEVIATWSGSSRAAASAALSPSKTTIEPFLRLAKRSRP